jgi:hypothetical protein
MTKTFTIIILSFFTFTVNAQTDKKQATAPLTRQVEPYGKIDTADLKLQNCEFEKDANAMVLFDYGDIKIDYNGNITFIRHKRIKIFNDNGKGEADINIPFVDNIDDITAETINLNGNTIEYTPVDTKLIYKLKVNKYRKALTFTFPNVKPYSVIELQYKWKIYTYSLPAWGFQSNIPTAYSELSVTIATDNFVGVAFKVSQDFTKKIFETVKSGGGTRTVRALSNIHSFKEEPFMTPVEYNLQRAEFKPLISFWQREGNRLLDDQDFGLQLNRKLAGEDTILVKITRLKNNNLIIDSIFNMIKTRMTWNKDDRWFTDAGIQKAWDKKTGNSTEINLILSRLLTKAGIQACPMVVSTPDNGAVDPTDAKLSQFNKTVTYVMIDSLKHYILDATSKYNKYNQVPFDLLSTYGFIVVPQTRKSQLITIQSDTVSQQLVYVNAEIKADGKMSGEANIVSDGYNREKSLKSYDKLGEKEYIGLLADNDNDIKIVSLKLDDTKSDTLPLTQHINFNLNLSASDDNYIYFNPNLFTTFGKNPFLNEMRYSDIDFHYASKYFISGTYKIPEGYKTDVLPKNEVLTMEDKGLSFKRVAGEQDGHILVRYIIARKKTYYTKEEYPALFKFYKRMYEMLNEQIVLKKI